MTGEGAEAERVADVAAGGCEVGREERGGVEEEGEEEEGEGEATRWGEGGEEEGREVIAG